MSINKKLPIAILLFLPIFLAKTAPAAAQQSAIPNPKPAIEWVNPFIGTGGHGHTFPGATMPFGMVQLSPDTRPDPGDWDGCSGYHYSDPMIFGFSHTHLSGTGVSDYCDVLLQPVQPGTSFEPNDFGSPFYKNTERAEPGYYEVFLDKPKVKVELTASERVGFHRYSFSKTAERGEILLDLKWRDVLLDSDLDMSRLEDGIVTGHRFSSSWAKDQRIFFFLKFSKIPLNARTVGKSLTILEFDLNGNHTVVAECAISSVDVAGAERNWQAETTKFDFEKAKTRAQSAWQNQLSKIEIEGGSDRDRTVFYTALYHTMIAPNIFSDVDGRYRGRDQQIHQAQKGATMYTVFSLWDTYRALHPLMTILEPNRVRDWMYTFWRQSEEGGKLPVWELAANETDCMIGNHSIPVIADAYLKGLVPDSLVEPLYEAMKKAATDGTRGLDLYDKLGYIPSDLEPESVSKTLEYSFDDYCISKVAEKMGQQTEVEFFGKRAENWKNLLDPESGFFRAKLNATFVEPFDPAEVNHNFTEGNAWQYAFLPHQIDQQVNFNTNFGQKLDSLFNTKSKLTGRVQADLTGLVGQFAIGNEPDMHVPFLFNWMREPQKSQFITQKILKDHFTDQPDGLPGNDDCGQMSAWVVFASMGFYPTNPIAGIYDRVVPVFSNVKIQCGSGTLVQTIQIKDPIFMEINTEPGPTIFVNTIPHIWFEEGKIPKNQPRDHYPFDHWQKGKLTPVPFLKKCDRVFTGSQILEIACIDTKAGIYYSIDGSDPTDISLKYNRKKPILIEKNTILKAIAIKDGEKSPIMTAEFTQQADRKNWKTTYQNQPNPQYTGRGERGLIDGLRGGADFRSGGWQGFDGKNLDITIDMGELKPVKKLSIGFLQDENSWIFLPVKVVFEISDDGKNWTPVGEKMPSHLPTESGFVLEDFAVGFPEKKARFIKIRGVSMGNCPPTHKGAGFASWIFSDEILVE